MSGNRFLFSFVLLPCFFDDDDDGKVEEAMLLDKGLILNELN